MILSDQTNEYTSPSALVAGGLDFFCIVPRPRRRPGARRRDLRRNNRHPLIVAMTASLRQRTDLSRYDSFSIFPTLPSKPLPTRGSLRALAFDRDFVPSSRFSASPGREHSARPAGLSLFFRLMLVKRKGAGILTASPCTLPCARRLEIVSKSRQGESRGDMEVGFDAYSGDGDAHA